MTTFLSDGNDFFQDTWVKDPSFVIDIINCCLIIGYATEFALEFHTGRNFHTIDNTSNIDPTWI